MPLSKAKMRERKRLDRSVKPTCNLTQPVVVKPKPDWLVYREQYLEGLAKR